LPVIASHQPLQLQALRAASLAVLDRWHEALWTIFRRDLVLLVQGAPGRGGAALPLLFLCGGYALILSRWGRMPALLARTRRGRSR